MRDSAVVTDCKERSHPITVKTVGLDLAKDVFVASGTFSIQFHGISENGRVIFNKAIKRAMLLTFFE